MVPEPSYINSILHGSKGTNKQSKSSDTVWHQKLSVNLHIHWQNHPDTTSGVLSPILALGGPQVDSGPFHPEATHGRGGPQVDSAPFHNVMGPKSTSSSGRATIGLGTFSSWPLKAVEGHKWTQHLLTMSGVLSPHLALGGPQVDSGPSHNSKSWVSSWLWEGLSWTEHFLTMSGVLSPLLALSGPQVDSGTSHNIESRVYSWLLKGHKWTQDLLITLGPNSTHGCPKATMNSKPLNLWELFYTQKLICLMYFKPSKCIWNGFHWYKE